jgi:hypothetical protein
VRARTAVAMESSDLRGEAGGSLVRRHGARGCLSLLAALLLAAPSRADTAVVPTDFATVQAAVDAVQGTPDALVRIDSSATFVGRVTVTESVRIEAGAGFRPTLEGVPGDCALVGPCTIELHTVTAGQRLDLRGLRVVPPAGIAPGSGGQLVLVFNESTQFLTLDIVEVELADPAGASFDGILSRVSPASPGANSIAVTDSRIDIRGLPPHPASAIEMGERGQLSVIGGELSLRGPPGNLLSLSGEQIAFVLSASLLVEAPAASLHAGVAQIVGASASTVSGNAIELVGNGDGTVGGVLLLASGGGGGDLLFDSNRIVGDRNGAAFAVTAEAFQGSLARVTAVNNEIRGLGGGFRLASQGGTVEAVLTNNTVHDSFFDAVQIEAFSGPIEVAIFNNLFTRTIGSGIDVELLGGTVAGELGYNGYFENFGGAIDPQLEPSSSADVFADPRYVATDDLRLQAASPMVDRANDSAPSVPKDDIDGVDRPVGAGFDIGAHEGAVQAAIVEVPALGPAGFALLTLALGAVGLRRIASTRQRRQP